MRGSCKGLGYRVRADLWGHIREDIDPWGQAAQHEPAQHEPAQHEGQLPTWVCLLKQPAYAHRGQLAQPLHFGYRLVKEFLSAGTCGYVAFQVFLKDEALVGGGANKKRQ